MPLFNIFVTPSGSEHFFQRFPSMKRPLSRLMGVRNWDAQVLASSATHAYVRRWKHRATTGRGDTNNTRKTKLPGTPPRLDVSGRIKRQHSSERNCSESIATHRGRPKEINLSRLCFTSVQYEVSHRQLRLPHCRRHQHQHTSQAAVAPQLSNRNTARVHSLVAIGSRNLAQSHRALVPTTSSNMDAIGRILREKIALEAARTTRPRPFQHPGARRAPGRHREREPARASLPPLQSL